MRFSKNHVTDKTFSRYLDNKISNAEKADLKHHFNGCRRCRNRLNLLKVLHKSVQQIPEPAMKRDVWASVEREISASNRSKKHHSRYSRWLMAAAVLLILITGGWLLPDNPYKGFLTGCESKITAYANPYAYDYGLYLSGLENPPSMRQFNEGYQRQKVDMEEAVSSLDLSKRSEVWQNLPEDFSIESVYLLDSACCKCMQINLEYDDQRITIFQQPEKHPLEFTGYHQKHMEIESTDCSVVSGENHDALTFIAKDAQYVVVGEQNDPMLATLMDRLSHH